MAKPTLHKELGPIYTDYTDIVIDGPPRIHERAKSIILFRRRGRHPSSAVTLRRMGHG